MAYLRDIEKLIRIGLAQGRPPHAGSPRRGTCAFAASRAHGPDRACSRPAAMKQPPVRKGLAVHRRPGGNGGAPAGKTATRPTGMSRTARRPSQGGGKAEGVQGVAFFASRKPSEYPAQPHPTTTLEVDRSGDNHG